MTVYLIVNIIHAGLKWDLILKKLDQKRTKMIKTYLKYFQVILLMSNLFQNFTFHTFQL